MLKTLKVRKIHLTKAMAAFSAFFAFCIALALCVVNIFAVLGQAGFELSAWTVIGWNVFLGLLAALFSSAIFSIFGMIFGWLFSSFYNRFFCRRSALELEVDCSCGCRSEQASSLLEQFKETDEDIIRKSLEEPRL